MSLLFVVANVYTTAPFISVPKCIEPSRDVFVLRPLRLYPKQLEDVHTAQVLRLRPNARDAVISNEKFHICLCTPFHLLSAALRMQEFRHHWSNLSVDYPCSYEQWIWSGSSVRWCISMACLTCETGWLIIYSQNVDSFHGKSLEKLGNTMNCSRLEYCGFVFLVRWRFLSNHNLCWG